MTPVFQYQLRVSQDSCLVQIWWFEPKSVMTYHMDKFSRILSKNGENAIEGQGQ